jgi:hypothetical protein
MEELGVQLLPTAMQLIADVTAPRDGAPGFVRMACYSAEHRGEPAPANEVVEVGWFTAADYDRVTRAEQQVIDLLVERGQMVR